MFKGYKAFVRAHAGLISTIESTLSSVIWLLPDRFSESEVSFEGLHSAIGLISLFHESILASGSLPHSKAFGVDWGFLLSAVQKVCEAKQPLPASPLKTVVHGW